MTHSFLSLELKMNVIFYSNKRGILKNVCELCVNIIKVSCVYCYFGPHWFSWANRVEAPKHLIYITGKQLDWQSSFQPVVHMNQQSTFKCMMWVCAPSKVTTLYLLLWCTMCTQMSKLIHNWAITEWWHRVKVSTQKRKIPLNVLYHKFLHL